jgi:hypothetical protein
MYRCKGMMIAPELILLVGGCCLPFLYFHAENEMRLRNSHTRDAFYSFPANNDRR